MQKLATLLLTAVAVVVIGLGTTGCSPEKKKTTTPAKGDAPKAEAPKGEAPKAEAPKAEAPKAEAPKAEAPK